MLSSNLTVPWHSRFLAALSRNDNALPSRPDPRFPRSLANDRGLLETDPDIAIVTDPSRADVTLLDLTDNDEPTLLPLATNGTRVLILIGESAPASLMAEVLASEASVVTDAVSRDQLVSALRAVAGRLMVRNQLNRSQCRAGAGPTVARG